MAIEYEATFADVNKAEIRDRLRKLGASLVKPEVFMKRVTFNLPLNDPGKWARVRDEGNRITMSFKSVIGNGIESQKEVELIVNDFEDAAEFLDSIGCIRKAYQESKREVWELENVEVMIDEWPFLEPFVEIEGKDEKTVKAVAEKLGFDYSKAIFSSVDEQYSAKYGITEDQVVNHTPEIKFDGENPFE